MEALYRPPKVWVIDDAKLDGIIIQLSIQKIHEDASITLVSNGKAALDMLIELANIDLSELPDIILLDVNMPEMSGWQFIDHLKELNIQALHHIQLYIISGSISAADVKRSDLDPFVANYFHKPISLDILRSIFEVGRPR